MFTNRKQETEKHHRFTAQRVSWTALIHYFHNICQSPISVYNLKHHMGAESISCAAALFGPIRVKRGCFRRRWTLNRFTSVSTHRSARTFKPQPITVFVHDWRPTANRKPDVTSLPHSTTGQWEANIHRCDTPGLTWSQPETAEGFICCFRQTEKSEWMREFNIRHQTVSNRILRKRQKKTNQTCFF